MSLVNDNLGELVDTITHEVSHAVDHLAEHIGEEDNFVNETRAYLSGHLAGQIFKICMHEKEKYARKASRKIPSKKGNGKRGPDVQVDQLSVGSAGSNSVPEQPSAPSGIENIEWGTISPSDPSV
jgi:hypothetical protein